MIYGKLKLLLIPRLLELTMHAHQSDSATLCPCNHEATAKLLEFGAVVYAQVLLRNHAGEDAARVFQL